MTEKTSVIEISRHSFIFKSFTFIKRGPVYSPYHSLDFDFFSTGSKKETWLENSDLRQVLLKRVLVYKSSDTLRKLVENLRDIYVTIMVLAL